MKNLFKLITATIALVGTMSPGATAQDGRLLPFSALVAPAASLAGEGIGERVVYLNWGPVSGALPPGLTHFRLSRNGVLIDAWDATSDASADEIATWYAAPQNARRRLEMARSLCLAEAGANVSPETVPTCAGAALTPFISNIGARIHLHLQRVRADMAASTRNHPNSHLFVAITTRLDPLVARARRLGTVDRVPAGAGPTVTYRLDAVRIRNGVETVVEVGTVAVGNPATTAPIPVPAAADFRQVQDRERGAACDTPSLGLVHGTIATTWKHGGGDSPLAWFQADQLIAGYDLYRSTRPLDGQAAAAGDDACRLDLQRLAATAGFDPLTAHIELPGLVRVSDAPILVVPGPTDPSLHVDDRPTLAAAGFQPGDRVCYHVVPRDVSGNWGPTTSRMFTVSDALTAPAPWDVEVVTTSAAEVAAPGSSGVVPGVTVTDSLAIRWTHIDVAAYLRDFDDGRFFCNLDSAMRERRVRVADGPDACSSDFHEVSLDVIGYRVYRFDSVRDAEAFRDTDGDGFPDQHERDAMPAGDPCDSNIHPPLGAPLRDGGSALDFSWLPAPSPEPASHDAGRRIVTFFDNALTTPALRGQRFWYRIVPVSASDRAGEPSPPIAAFFPDKTQPEPPVLTVGRQRCSRQARAEGSSGLPLAFDNTCEAEKARVICVDSDARNCVAFLDDDSGKGKFGFDSCRALMGRDRNFDHVLARAEESGAFTEADRIELLSLALAMVARATLWEAPFEGCVRSPGSPGKDVPYLVTPGVALLSQEACETAVLPRVFAGGCDLAVQFVARGNRVIDVQWDPEVGSPSPWVPIHDNPYFTPWEPEDPSAPDAGCWFTATLDEGGSCWLETADDGQVIDGPLTVEARVAPGHCIDISEDVPREPAPAGQPETDGVPRFPSDLYRVAMQCDDDRDGLINMVLPPGSNQDQATCLKASAHSPSNVVSAPTAAPCLLHIALPAAPVPPRLESFDIDPTGVMMLGWRRPETASAGAIVEWYRNDGAGYGTTFLAGALASGQARERLSRPATAPGLVPQSGEVWCVRARTVVGGAQGANMSDWTGARCTTVPDAVAPPPNQLSSIPWPAPVLPAVGQPLESRYAPVDGAFVIRLSAVDRALHKPGFGGFLACATPNMPAGESFCPDNRYCAESTQGERSCDWAPCICNGVEGCFERCADPARFGSQSLCLVAESMVRAFGRFAVYRQQRAANGDVGPFVQVSAVIEKPVCHENLRCLAFTNECWRDGWIFDDPDLAFVRMTDNDFGFTDLVFVDRFPHTAESDMAYRHEVVFFDSHGEITGRRLTGWVSPAAEP